MRSKYIYRMDDITPDMDWNQFWKYTDLFRKYNIKPLLGIVPDNRDKDLLKQSLDVDFWHVMRKLKEENIVEFAQHGYQHLFTSKERGILGKIYGFKQQSEFAGLPYNKQFDKIKAGTDILRSESIFTDIWMAPSHSFDKNTLKVLKDTGFKAVTDGIALYPYMKEGLVFVPQQLWKPKWVPFGIWTICLHVNNLDNGFYHVVEKHLKSGAEFITFSEAARYPPGFFKTLLNVIFKFCYLAVRLAKNSLKNR